MKKATLPLVGALIGLATLTPLSAHATHAAVATARGRATSSPYYYNSPRRPAPRRYYYGNSATAAIATAAARWGVNYYWLLRVASCESGLNPSAYNPSGASGLFQFMPGTYYAYAARIGERGSIWNAYSNANVAAYMFSIGQAYQWGCV